MRIELEPAPVDDAGDQPIGADHRAERQHPRRVEPLDLVGEAAGDRLQRVEPRQHRLVRCEQRGGYPAERNLGEALGRIEEEAAAVAGERADDMIADAVVREGHASARTVIAGRLLRFEQQHAPVRRESCARRKPGHAAADDDEVRTLHATRLAQGRYST